MKAEYKQSIEKSLAEKEVIKKTFQKLKQKKPKELDAAFHSLHDKAFQKIDCLACANCCKTTSPIFRDVDIKRIAKYLRMKEQNFIQQYLRMDEENDYVLQQSPCSFLGADNKCDIYEFRSKLKVHKFHYIFDIISSIGILYSDVSDRPITLII